MREETKTTHLGRHPERFAGAVSTPVFRASTILSADVAEWEQKKRDRADGKPGTYYGLSGTPSRHLLEEALAEIEGGYKCQLYPSGLAACTIPILGYVRAGDHVLVTDSVYGPTRRFCTTQLARLGVETTFYDPLIGAGIKQLMRSNTRLVFTESPGSLTFEVQDIPAIAAAAHAAGAVVMLDNTWGTPLYFKPFEHGVDVSIQATTKYIVGHSDVIMGSVTCTREAWPGLDAVTTDYGQTAAPDDCFLAARGLRSMARRLPIHWESGLRLAEWIAQQPEVEVVLHPALPGAPGHDLWKRDFRGACGLFGVVLKPMAPRARDALIDALELFGIGASWGGFESLAIPFDAASLRTATRWHYAGPCFRVHAGLEHIDDLIADMAGGFVAMRAAL
ncbi:MAG: cystathionine beta-lyase [Burkholderiales bacterium]|nr:cystathionine beta-lyase [Burkholderiales bacterium]